MSFIDLTQTLAEKFNQKNRLEEGPLPPKDFGSRKNEQHLNQRACAFWWAIIISTLYLIGMVIIICVCFAKNNGLSDNVIIALLTSTTATIIGLPALMIKSLFQKEK
jgi:hypothetical protein